MFVTLIIARKSCGNPTRFDTDDQKMVNTGGQARHHSAPARMSRREEIAFIAVHPIPREAPFCAVCPEAYKRLPTPTIPEQTAE
jgi:hypothetical protein